MPSLYTRQQLILGPALNVTVREGDKAVMPCIAPHLGDKTVKSRLSYTTNEGKEPRKTKQIPLHDQETCASH